ncbi:MAG: retropepsin-like domain-containing protein, partial [Prevotellaceae bacterium]|nr:retropepsin-like domain-containing protein [Prevotellaceae bacterium]
AQSKLSEDRLLFYKANVEHVFNHCQLSNQYISRLFDRHKEQLNDTIIPDVLALKASNHIRLYQYQEAADAYHLIISQYGNALDSANIAAYENVRQLWQTVSAVKPQRIRKPHDVNIAAYRNQFNHLMTPVRCGQITDEFIFDTGANLSTISEIYAKKMALTVYESNVQVKSSTNISVQTKLAVADSLYVGDVLFENVVFLVVPDEQISFPSVNYYIHGIIGFPVIYQMDEIHLSQNGTIFVPEQSQDKPLRNMYIEMLHLVAQLQSGADSLLFMMDTGARTSDLSAQYYGKHKDVVEKEGVLQHVKRGGAGGVEETTVYQLKNFPYTIGSKSGVLPEISVNTTLYSEHYDGALGQDVLLQFNKMILNFQYMYVDFE